jgi:hypothetical protein
MRNLGLEFLGPDKDNSVYEFVQMELSAQMLNYYLNLFDNLNVNYEIYELQVGEHAYNVLFVIFI